jgi:hypothetical protein
VKQALLLFLCIISQGLAAQIEQSGRFEMEFDWRNDAPFVISTEEKGFLMVQSILASQGKDYPLVVIQMDTDLKVVWEDSIRIQREFHLIGYHYTNNKTYLLLQNSPAKTKVRVLAIDNESRQIISHEAKDLLEIEIEEFEIVQNSAVIGGYYDGRPVVMAYDLENDKVRTLPNVFKNNSKLVEVKVNKDGVTFNVLISQDNLARDKTILVSTYDYLGNPVRDYEILTKPEYSLINGVSSSINDISQVVTGLYGYKSDANPAGLYINYIDRVGQQTMQYLSFGELNHFFAYLGEKKAAKYRKKALNAKKAGKEMRYRVHPLLSELIEDDDHYVLFGEFIKGFSNIDDINSRYGGYDGVGRNYNNRGLNSYNDPFTNNGLGNMGTNDFEFSHAYTLVLDKQGNIMWDDWAEIDKEMSGLPTNMGELQWLDNRAVYLYYSQEELHGKLMDSTITHEPLVSELALRNENDVLGYENENSLLTIKWYDNHFLVSGVQNIKTDGDASDQKKVFFINKVSINVAEKAKGLD